MFLTHDILKIIIGYLPRECVVHLQGTPFEDYAFNHALSEVTIDVYGFEDYFSGFFPHDKFDVMSPGDQYTELLPDFESWYPPPGSYRYSMPRFKNVYKFRRFLEEFPRYRPRRVIFKSHHDIMILLKSHAHILREAQIDYAEVDIYDMTLGHFVEEDESEYIERMNRVLALPCQFKRVYFWQQRWMATWDDTTFRIPESVCEVDFSSQNSHNQFRGFVEGLASLPLTKITLYLPEAPPPSLFPPSLRILNLEGTILPESFCMGNMPNLRELKLDDHKSTCESLDLSELSIVKLKLDELGVKSLEQVAFPQTLRELIINNSKIQDLRGIQVPLTHLEVSYCGEIKALEFPDTLRKLNLDTVGKKFNGETRTASDKFFDHSVKLPKNLYSLSIYSRGTFPVRGTLELPPMLTDLDLSCCCLELPRLPDSIEYLKLKTRGIKSLEGVVWPRQLVSLSVKDSDLEVFPCHSLLGLDRLREVYVDYNGFYQERSRFKRALRTGEVNSIVSNLGSIRLRTVKDEAKDEVIDAQDEEVSKYNCAKIPNADGSLFSLKHLSFSTLKMGFREGFLVSLSCPEDFDLKEIPETIEVFRSKGIPPERIPSSLKELYCYSVDFNRAQELSEQLPESMERLSLICEEYSLSASFSVQCPKLQELVLKFPASDLSLGCPNLTKMTLDCAKLPDLYLDKFPRGLVLFSVTNCEVKHILGSFVRFDNLESVCLSYNKLAGYLAQNTLELPPSVVVVKLCWNELAEIAGVRIGNRMDVVDVTGNPDIPWQTLAKMCQQMRPRQGSVYASLRDPTGEFLSLHSDDSSCHMRRRSWPSMEKEYTEKIEQLREYIFDEKLLKVWWNNLDTYGDSTGESMISTDESY